MMSFVSKKLLIVFSLLSFFSIITAQENPHFGSIKGIVVDSETKQPLVGANIFMQDSNSGTSTDISGNYQFDKIKVGTYSIIYSYIGYEKIIKTDIIVRTNRITFVNIELKPTTLSMENVVVTSGYFNEEESQPMSITSFSSEEIRRAPGSAGDVSRIIFGLPSLAKINDTKNSLIVRGGSPVENGFYLDNIEIPNINHFPVQGSTEGPIGIINVDLIDNVNFISGGFNSDYGDKLSSIMELKFREGNRVATDVQLDMSMQGFGGVIEGPINKGTGSYMLSVRRSYLDILFGLFDKQAGIPAYSDVQGKAVYDLSPNNKLSVLDVFSSDKIKTNQDKAAENKDNIFNDYKSYFNTAGINWQYLWGKHGYSNTSLSHTYSNTDAKFFQTRDGKLLLNNKSVEQEYKLRNVNHWILSNDFKAEFGFDAKYISTEYNQFYNEYQDLLGNKTEAMSINRNINTYKAGVFTNLIWQPLEKISFMPGIRVDYYDYNETLNVSPRLSATYAFNDETTLTGTFGIYYQNIPWVLATQKDEFKNLKNPKATHYVVGLNHLLTESTKLTLEVYNKDYSDFPMDPSQPNFFIFDQAVLEGIFLNHENLINSGVANSKGIELTIQKKLATDFYGLLAASYFRAKYKDLNGKWYDRLYDNRFTFAIEGGYKPNEKWEFSLRWLYAGGAPYTPFDEDASRKSFKGVLDNSRINSSRLPDFHSLNIRVDRRFYFQSSTMVVYLSIWNAYGRKNVAAYSWNEIDNKIDTEKMWGTLPVFGIEYEF